jgi:hypothetical protein
VEETFIQESIQATFEAAAEFELNHQETLICSQHYWESARVAALTRKKSWSPASSQSISLQPRPKIR